MLNKRKNLKSVFCFFLAFWALVITLDLSAQTGTTRGKEFFISVMPNGADNNANQVILFLTTLEGADGLVTVIGTDFVFPVQMSPNSSQLVEIPAEHLPSGAEVIESKGIHIEVDGEISAYVVNQANATTDGTMALPLESIGDDYMIHTYVIPPPQSAVTPSEFVILATEDSTLVEVTFTANTRVGSDITHNAGETIEVELMRGEQVIYFSREDLTGSTVRVITEPGEPCKKIAVFAGHVTTLVGVELGPDHLYNQMYPVADWGKEYIALPIETRFLGHPVKILAAQNNTRIRINGAPLTLDRGENHLFEIDEPTYIEADKPISVLQLTKGRNADVSIRNDDLADPFMIALSPISQTVNDLAFYMLSNARMRRHFVNVVTPTANLNVSLNGQDISDRFSPVPAKPEYSHATFNLNPTFHTMSSTNGFVGHAYAFGDAESIGYALGGDLGEFRVRIFDEQFGLVSDGNFAAQVCEASELTFRVDSDIPALKEAYTRFEWDMGDGTILFGDEVTHEYEDAGSYSVRLTASKTSSICSNLVVDRLIEIVEDGVEGIFGPESVCPNAKDIRYFVEGTVPGYTYQWFVDGGTIDGSRNQTDVVIDWSITDPGARVRVLARSPEGCLSDTLDLPIVLNPDLEPVRPIGPSQLCVDNVTDIVYSTPPATGSIYTWMVEGGQIVAGQGSPQVTVRWNGTGTHSISYLESTTTRTDVCAGESPPLQVIVYEPLVAVPTVDAVSCNGLTDGQASLEITGGLAPYNITWNTGATSTSISNLGAIVYEVEIIDALGCDLSMEVPVSQPEPLIGFMEVRDAICNGERGFAVANIEGGTRPYTFNWSTGTSSQNNLLSDLSMGSYNVQVVDANGCEITLPFSVIEPSALEAEFTMEQSCPGVPDGSLTLDVRGGTAPYTFVWEFNPLETSNVLGDITDGTYRVTVIDAGNCELEMTGVVTNETPMIRLPNAFSPNDDDSNDEFKPVYNCALDFRMIIYNRWGQPIFETSDIDVGWDGTVNGEPAPQGAYTYDATYGGLLNGVPFTEVVRGRFRLIL